MKIIERGNILELRCKEKIGGKARGLQMLVQEGYTVPDTYVISIGNYDEFLKEQHSDESVESLADIIAEYMVSSSTESFILRSSSEAEDGKEMSFSGVFTSAIVFKNEEKKQIIKKIQQVLYAPLNRTYISYCNGHNKEEYPKYFSLLIQPYICGEWSGVMFSADPIYSDNEIVVIECVLGGNEAVTDGSVTPALIRIDTKNWTLLEFEPGDTEFSISKDTISKYMILAACGKKIEALAGTPQDIEWMYYKNEFVFLQARPITTINL